FHPSLASSFLNFYDFKKAFDSVSHDSIHRTLLHIGAPHSLISLIDDMYDNCTARVRINGWLTPSLPLKRGTKQGDPLSPLIYALTVESLSQTFTHKL